MGFFFYDNKQITGNTVMFARISFPIDRKLHSFSHTGRNFHFHDFFSVYNTFSCTSFTFVLNYFPFSVTLWTYAL